MNSAAVVWLAALSILGLMHAARVTALALTAILLSLPAARPAAAQHAEYGPDLAPFVEVLEAYAGGRTAADDTFAGWTENRWQAGRRALGDHAGMDRYLRIGAVLYLDRAVDAWAEGDAKTAEDDLDRGYRYFVSVSERQLGQRAFCAAWYRTAIAAALERTHPETAERLIGWALDHFSRDVGVQLFAGILKEMRAWFFQPGPAPGLQGRPGNNLRNERDRRYLLDEAASAYQAAIALDPASPDAHLRLGRVLMLHDKGEEAAAQFDAVLAADQPALIYLAHLFRGQLAERSGDLARAEDEYTEALNAGTPYQTGLIALSRIEAERREVPLAQGRIVTLGSFRRYAEDPWWQYLSGRIESSSDEWPVLREAIRP